MLKIIQLLSDVQNEIGDLAMESIQRKEWVDIANDIAMDVAEETHVYIGRYIHTPKNFIPNWEEDVYYPQGYIVNVPNADTKALCTVAHWSNAQNYINAPLPGTMYPDVDNSYWQIIRIWGEGIDYAIQDLVSFEGSIYRCIKAHRSEIKLNDPNFLNYWALFNYENTNQSMIMLPFAIGQNNINPYKIIRVIRGYNDTWSEMKEYSQQAVARTLSNNSSFEVNRTSIANDGYAVQHMNSPNSSEGSMYIIMARPMENTETVIIDYVSNRPWGDPYFNESTALFLWEENTSQTIPDYLRNVFKYGILWKVLERLYNKGNEAMLQRAERAKAEYTTMMNKAAAYTRNIKSKAYNLKMQPINWLEE